MHFPYETSDKKEDYSAASADAQLRITSKIHSLSPNPPNPPATEKIKLYMH